MPRGRHRHSQPLHRLLPPLTVACCAAVLAAASLFAGDPAVLRAIAGATALTACAGALLARNWDRSAGREVAELTAARVRDEWHTDERIAEVETDLEESREIRTRLEKKLRSKRAELARLRTEHAELLRRYATAESERARALEAKRRLQVEGTNAPQPLALTTGAPPVGPAAYLKAFQALRDLPRNAASQQAQRTVEEARRREAAAVTDDRQGKHASGAPTALPVREHRLVPAAAAVLPYAQRGSSATASASGNRAIGGFDFFGTQSRKALESADAGQDPAREHEQAAETPADPEVIDLTAHDETEQLDVTELRAQV
ncbi:hypothetical protein [Actinacidiphila acidipaludis]|uniref:Secreted protein n=1 Tax=Actinacidiphila acidipaludis TaxID=2873382 RepID=A0ABS7Q856_9ACTN|nr:hypothetical protein [Streptomyces acidipaludis]MBY8878884.1 hypothetical protein [Streptomyces acidipaludis]